MRLMIIHPFDDGNGRLGRILVNAELTRGKLLPYFIFDENESTEAILADKQGSVDSFKKHLTENAP